MIIQAALPTDQVAAVQRRTIAVLSTAQILSGIAIAGAVPVGALLAGSIAGSDAAAGLAQTFTITGSALIALPLARIALSRGRRVALSTGFGIGAVGAVVIIGNAIGHRRDRRDVRNGADDIDAKASLDLVGARR